MVVRLKRIQVRDQLKNITESDYWIYGITEADFDHAIDFIRELIRARADQYEMALCRFVWKAPVSFR